MSSPSAMLAGSVWQAIAQCLPQALLLLDVDLRVVVGNRAASALFAAHSDSMRGVHIGVLVPDANLDTLLGNFNTRRRRIIETSLVQKVPRRRELTIKVTALPLALASQFDQRQRPISSVRRQQFLLLVIEDITEKAGLEHKLVESEKHVAMGQLAAGILHEVNNPLAGLGSNLTFVRSAIDPKAHPDAVQALDASLEQLDQMRQLLGTLSGFGGRPPAHYESVDVHDVIRRALAFIAHDADSRGVVLGFTCAPSSLMCEIDVRLIRQVLLNLFKNAMEAMPDGGRLEVTTSCRASEDANTPTWITIEITDTGTGIAEPDLRRVFRPLFSTKPRGAGLGLSFCRQAVEEHSGHIRLTNRGKLRGTAAIVTLPVCQPGASDD